MNLTTIKEEAQELLEQLPDNATWDDLMYKIYIRKAIEAGVRDSESGRTIDVKEIRESFGLSE